LVFQLGTRIPGGGDAPWFLWQLWWFKHALIDLTRTPLSTDLIFYPATEVVINWQTPVNEFFLLPLQLAVGTVPFYNLLILGNFVLSGYFMYLLILKLVKQPLLAFVAGAIFAFNAYHSVRSLGHLSLASTQWLPLALLLLIQAWYKPSIRRGMAAGIGVALAMLASPYYAAYFVFPVIGCFAVYVFLTRRFSLLARPGVGSAALAGLVTTGALILPFYVDYLSSTPELRQAAQVAAKSVFVYVADLLSWILPPRNNPIWQSITAGLYDKFTSGYLVESALFFGFLPPLLALCAFFERRNHPRQLVFWLLLAASTWLLSFGPILKVWGTQLVDWMPYRLFMALPGAYAFRAPARLGITAILAATVAAMYVLKRWKAQKPQWPWRRLIAIWTAVLLANLSTGFPFPTSSTQIPPVYKIITETPGEFAILELPSGELFLENVAWYMYYQTSHQKRLVSGYLGRRPASLINQTHTLPFVNRFFVDDYANYFSGKWDQLIDWPDSVSSSGTKWPGDILNGSQLLSDLNIRYVILHKDLPHAGFVESAALLLDHALGPPIYADADALLFETKKTTLASRNAPAFAYDVPADDRPAGSPPLLHYRLDARRLALSGPAVELATFDLPFMGDWDIRGLLDGEGVPGLRFSADGNSVEPVLVPLFANVYAFSLQGHFAPGQHTLQVQHSAAASPEGDVCIVAFYLHARLKQLDLPQSQDAPSDFVNQNGQRFRLLGAGIISDSGSASEPATYFYTAWQTLGSTTPITAQLCLDQFTHITTPDGAMLAQADHQLGWSGIVDSEGVENSSKFVDFVEVPLNSAAIQPDSVVRIGLWCPETRDYFWVADSTGLDDSGRLVVGSWADLQVPKP